MKENGEILKDRMVPSSSVSRMPCEIKYNGSAPVSEYFVVNDDNKVKEAMFRGRLLKGERVSLPDNMEGFIYLVWLFIGLMLVRKKDQQGKDVYEVAASFDEMTDWNTDSMPDKLLPTSVSSCIQWMQMNAAVGIGVVYHIDS